MQFQKLTISITLATLAVSAQQYATIAMPSASYASTKYDAILQQFELQTTQSKLQKSINRAASSSLMPHTSTKYETIIQQLELQKIQPQATQSQATQSQAIPSQTIQSQSQKSISTNQARKTFFSHSPRLVRAAAFPNGGNVSSSYEFTLTVPEDAGQPLKAVTIAQAINVETVRFDATNTKASLGRRLTSRSAIQLSSIGGEQPSNPGEATIVFEQPVQPGNTVTISLSAEKNPNWGGVYLFGVTAYPDGENGLGQFLGYGRINFYGNSR